MRNVIIFATDGVRYAVELRWVREVISLGYLTPVPRAPAHIAGVANVRGAITPVLDINAFRPESVRPKPAQAGEPFMPERSHGAVVIDVDGVVAALRMDKVDEVATATDVFGDLDSDAAASLVDAESGDASVLSGVVFDSREQPVPVIDPSRVIRIARSAARSSGEPSAPSVTDGVPHVVL